MKERIKDFATGILFLVIGIFFKVHSQSYELGSASAMGPGYYPDFISSILILVGIIIVVKSLVWS